MKKSGYRTVFHVYLIFLLSLIGTFAAVCCICLSMITVQNPEGKNLRSNWAKIFTQEFSENIRTDYSNDIIVVQILRVKQRERD